MSTATVGRAGAPRRHRTIRHLIVAALVLLLVAALFVVADRVVQRLAQDRIAAEIQSQLGTPEPPDVDLGPFPFLTEIATGRVESAHVTAAEVALPNSNGATVRDVDATFSGITGSDRFARIVADRGTATGMLSYPSLSALTGLDLQYAGPDRVQVRFDTTVGSYPVAGTVTGRPVLDVAGQTLEITDAELSVTSVGVPQPVVDAAGQFILRPVPVETLPYNLRLTAIAVREDGVQITATGEDLPLRG